MAVSDYPKRRLVDIKLQAAKVASVPMDVLAALPDGRLAGLAVELQAANDALDEQAQR